jgi:hypothetical protein
MKTLALLAILTFTFCQTAFSQDPEFKWNTADTSFVQSEPARKAYVQEGEEAMSLGSHPSMTVMLEVTDKKMAEKVWKDFMKDYGGKTKKMKGGNEDLTTGAEIVGINGVNPLEIYSNAIQGLDGYVEFTVWFNLGDEYLARNRRPQYQEAEKILLKFAHETKKEQTKNELEDAEKKLKSLDNDLDKLKRQLDNYHKAIADAERRIQEAKDNIVTNEQQQADTSQKIDLQKELVEEIKRRLADMKKN